jgi:radical SAM superfamily enzyme
MPAALLEVLARFPPGGVQLEVGIQTFNEETARNISRRQNYAKLEHNLRFLRSQTGVHIHADLIAGLPGETLESFGHGFDRLLAMEPQEIQVGILKRLRGTPIVRHDREWGMQYSPHAPYEILCNRQMDFATLQRIRRFARFWDLLANSGRFTRTLPLLWSGGASQ